MPLIYIYIYNIYISLRKTKTGYIRIFLKEIIALWCQFHYQENLNVHSWMIFCPDGIIPDSDLTGLNNTYIYILYIYKINLNRESEFSY